MLCVLHVGEDVLWVAKALPRCAICCWIVFATIFAILFQDAKGNESDQRITCAGNGGIDCFPAKTEMRLRSVDWLKDRTSCDVVEIAFISAEGYTAGRKQVEYSLIDLLNGCFD